METIILTLHIIVCVLLVLLVLLQAGKEGMGVIFGGGSSSVLGSAGAGGVLTKLTAFMAVIFVGTSLGYTYVTSVRPGDASSILNVQIEEVGQPAAQPTATPEAGAAPDKGADVAKPATPEANTAPDKGADTPKPATPEANTAPDKGADAAKPATPEANTAPDKGADTPKPATPEAGAAPDKGADTSKPATPEAGAAPDKGAGEARR